MVTRKLESFVCTKEPHLDLREELYGGNFRIKNMLHCIIEDHSRIETTTSCTSILYTELYEYLKYEIFKLVEHLVCGVKLDNLLNIMLTRLAILF